MPSDPTVKLPPVNETPLISPGVTPDIVYGTWVPDEIP